VTSFFFQDRLLLSESSRFSVESDAIDEAEEYCELKITLTENGDRPGPLHSAQTIANGTVLPSNHISNINAIEPVCRQSSELFEETDISVTAATASSSGFHPRFLSRREDDCPELPGDRYHFDDPSQHAVPTLLNQQPSFRNQSLSQESVSYTTQDAICAGVLGDVCENTRDSR